MHILSLSAFFVYFALLLFIGLICHKKQTTSSDYIMGNRSLNFWLVALSAHASDMSSWLFMAFPVSIFILGLPQVGIALGLLIGMYLNWQYVAPKLRTMTEDLHSYTLPTFFHKRFNDTSKVIQIVSSLAMLIFLTHYLSAGLVAMGRLLENLFGIDYFLGLTIMMLVVVIYTFVGGFVTVAWTDLFQGLFLLVMVIAIPIIAFFQIDGWEQIAHIANQKKIPLSFVSNNGFSDLLSIVTLAISWGLGYFGMPHIITKFMGL